MCVLNNSLSNIARTSVDELRESSKKSLVRINKATLLEATKRVCVPSVGTEGQKYCSNLSNACPYKHDKSVRVYHDYVIIR